MNTNTTELEDQNVPNTKAGRVNHFVFSMVTQVAKLGYELPCWIWFVALLALCLLGFLSGFQSLLVIGLWILIVVFTILAITFGLSFAKEIGPKGFMGADGKLATLCCSLAAVLLASLLPTNNSTANKKATLDYWTSIQVSSNRFKTASKRLEATFSGLTKSSADSNPLGEFRNEVVLASSEINKLSIAGVDPGVVELAIELDEILLETLAMFDNAVEYLARQMTIVGIVKSLFWGNKEELTAMNDLEKRLQERAIRWNEKLTATRISLSQRYKTTFPGFRFLTD